MLQRSLVTLAAALAWALPVAAHHSFAIYDMAQNVAFEGVVETLKLRNPHMALTLATTAPDGTKRIVNFVEGAPANMIVRLGLSPEDVAPGKSIKAIGAPRKDDPNAFFLKAVILPDGRRINAIGN